MFQMEGVKMEQYGKELITTVEEIVADVARCDEDAKANSNEPPCLSCISSRELVSFLWEGRGPLEFQHYSAFIAVSWRSGTNMTSRVVASTGLSQTDITRQRKG